MKGKNQGGEIGLKLEENEEVRSHCLSNKMDMSRVRVTRGNGGGEVRNMFRRPLLSLCSLSSSERKRSW